MANPRKVHNHEVRHPCLNNIIKMLSVSILVLDLRFGAFRKLNLSFCLVQTKALLCDMGDLDKMSVWWLFRIMVLPGFFRLRTELMDIEVPCNIP